MTGTASSDLLARDPGRMEAPNFSIQPSMSLLILNGWRVPMTCAETPLAGWGG